MPCIWIVEKEYKSLCPLVKDLNDILFDESNLFDF